MPDIDETTHPYASPLEKGRQLRDEVREHPRAVAISLLLAVLGSIVGTTLTSFMGGSQIETLAGATIGPVVLMIFRPAPRGLRVALIVSLSLVALIVTVTGVTIADVVRGKEGTIVPIPPATPEPQSDQTAPSSPGDGTEEGGSSSKQKGTGNQPAVVAEAAGCGAVPIDNDWHCEQGIVVKSTGTAPLQITSVELDEEEFSVQQDACRQPLESGDECELEVYVRAAGDGQRETTVTIHQNLPSPDTGTRVTLTAEGMHPEACQDGYRWREAYDGDHVCISDEAYEQFQADSQAGYSSERKEENSDYCISGYVWRVAHEGDLACVTPDVRDLMHELNANPEAHRRF